jgi:DNA-directed RNA polymerase subunit RPC12/RpoP
MAYVYKCNGCGASVETVSARSLRCSECGQPMQEVARENWLMKCHSCGYSAESAVPRVTSCPMCDGQLCPSRPI